MKPRLRIHIIPVGFQVMRAVGPVQSLHADQVILITRSKDDDASEYLDKIIELLAESSIPYEIMEREIWNVSTIVKSALEIALQNTEDEIFFNVSTGAKTASIAGTLASMFVPIQPYYQAVDYNQKGVYFEDDYPCKDNPSLVPTFRSPEFRHGLLDALLTIAEHRQPITKKQLLAKLKENKIIEAKPGTKFPSQALHGQVDSLLEKLETLDYITIKGKRSDKRIEVNWKGREAAIMFEPLREHGE